MYYRNRKTVRSEILVVGDFGARITWLCQNKKVNSRGHIPQTGDFIQA